MCVAIERKDLPSHIVLYEPQRPGEEGRELDHVILPVGSLSRCSVVCVHNWRHNNEYR